jgi:hypothetical protein
VLLQDLRGPAEKRPAGRNDDGRRHSDLENERHGISDRQLVTSHM